jgi:hypothetical protein
MGKIAQVQDFQFSKLHERSHGAHVLRRVRRILLITLADRIFLSRAR